MVFAKRGSWTSPSSGVMSFAATPNDKPSSDSANARGEGNVKRATHRQVAILKNVAFLVSDPIIVSPSNFS
jgi:hypothetical protein